ncbi:hypothetical protein IAR50_000363 [Cryptococcus sp. DSM 104548]
MAPGYSYLPKLDLKDISVEAAAFAHTPGQNNCHAGASVNDDNPTSHSSSYPSESIHSDTDTLSSTASPVAAPDQLTALQQSLDEAHKQKNKLAQRLGDERKKTKTLLLRISSAHIDPAVITLLACRLAEHGAADPSNGVAEVAAALIDEVDRARDCADGRDGGLAVVVEEDVIAAKTNWNEAKERRIWNLEGVVQIMCSRVDSLEQEITKLKRARGHETSLGMSWTEDMEWEEEQETLELVESTTSRVSLRLDNLERDVATLRE